MLGQIIFLVFEYLLKYIFGPDLTIILRTNFNINSHKQSNRIDLKL